MPVFPQLIVKCSISGVCSQHVASKRHERKMKSWPDDTDDPIRLAHAGEEEFEEAETHAERMQVRCFMLLFRCI